MAGKNKFTQAGMFNRIETLADCTEHHFHTKERWYGKKAGADELTALDLESLTVFQMDSGDNTWGTAICIKGTNDIPVAGMIEFDMRSILLVATERLGVHKIRFAWGNTYAGAITAGDFTEMVINPSATSGRSTHIETRMPELPIATKVWANVWCAQNTGTVDFMIGFHGYEIDCHEQE